MEEFAIESDEPRAQHTLRRPFKLEEKLVHLQGERLETDLLFCCKGGIVMAHAAYLQAHSPLLRNIFTEQGSMKKRIVNVMDWSVEEVRNGLQVLYTGYASLGNYKEGSSVRTFLQELQIDGIFKISPLQKDIEVASTKPKINYFTPIITDNQMTPECSELNRTENNSESHTPKNGWSNHPHLVDKMKSHIFNRSHRISSSSSIAYDSTAETSSIREEFVKSPSHRTDSDFVETSSGSRIGGPVVTIPNKPTGRGSKRGGARFNSLTLDPRRRPITKTIEITKEEALKIKALSCQLKIDMTKNNQISTYVSPTPKNKSIKIIDVSDKEGRSKPKPRSRQKRRKEKSITPIKNLKRNIRDYSIESSASEGKKARVEEVKPGCPEVLNDEKKYKDKEWFWKQATRCQSCETQHTTPVDASNCVIGHVLLRCYFCFALVKDTERLFEHFKNSHKKSVFPGRENCLVCPMCDASVPYKSVSCHVISLHLNSKENKKEAREAMAKEKMKREEKESQKPIKIKRSIDINIDGHKLTLKKKEVDHIKKYTLIGKSITGREKTVTINTKR